MQELVQKEGIPLPIYSTNIKGESHVPVFVSTVEIEGQIFIGEEAKTKKNAEINAAKVAYNTLKERECLFFFFYAFVRTCAKKRLMFIMQMIRSKLT